jgi:hypothetical protein
MRNRITILLSILTGIAILWLGYTFGVKPTVTVQSDENVHVLVSAAGKTVYDGQDKTFRLDPGSYIVQVTSGQSGISKRIDVSPFGSATITVPKASLLHTSLIAPVALYQAFPIGNSYIGFDPADTTIKRLAADGSLTPNLDPAINSPEADAPLPNPATDYQPYLHNQALVASNGRVYVVGNTGAKEISTVGISIDTKIETDFIIASQPQSAAFAVGYKQDIYWYNDVNSAPQKIYTAKKEFNRLVYGGKTIGIYDTRIPPSRQDLRQFYSNHQNDLLLVDTAANNKEQTLTGPLSEVTLSPDGTFAVIQPRFEQPYLYNIANKQQVTTVDLPLSAGPYWTSNTTYLFSHDASVWQYDTAATQSTLIGQVPAPVTAFYKDDSGAITVSAYAGSQSAGLYRLGQVTAATQAADKLKAALPYNDNSISITYTTLSGQPRVTITTKAPLNSANQIDRYKRETVQLRQQALNYLIAQGIDPATLTITYDPADPL